MAAPSNNRAKKGKTPAPNGSANGHLNGHLNGHTTKSKMNGSSVVPSSSSSSSSSSKTGRPRRSASGRLTSVIGRLLSWYLIATFLFRCPSSITKLSETSPKVCTPYLHTRLYAAPYLDPYYQTYVAPQVDKVKPYVDRLDQQVYTPLSTFTKDKYAVHGAHRVEQAQKYARAEWSRTVLPQLENVQAQAKSQYNKVLAPHVDQALEATAPFYQQTIGSLVEIYHLSLYPAYEATLPYARQGYAHGHHVVSHIIFPNVLVAKDAAWKFISRTLWPQVRVLYGDNVEPQLVRIRERLGRYKDQQKVESVIEAADSESSTLYSTTDAVSSNTGSISSSASTTPGSGWKVLDDFFGESSTSSSDTQTLSTSTESRRPQPTGEELREKLTEDLRNWQTKFATAADKGAEDLETRVAEITKRQVENSVNGHGAALVVQLEETAESAISALKKFIIKTVKSLPENPTEKDLDLAFEECNFKTRDLGIGIKKRAEAVRAWKGSYDLETDTLIQSAVASTVEVLEKIHGLGLQEVGMRWAWLDGVTYKDWQNYHKLRNTLTEWQAEVEAVGSKHEGLRVAHEEGNKLEEKAMATVSTSVNELVRLKDVSKWKIWAEDATDDFTSKKVPARVFNAAQQVLENAQDVSSKASEAILGSETPATESIASVIKESASIVSSKISESASTAATEVSSSVIGSETPATESLASEFKSQASQVSSKASQAVAPAESSAGSDASEVLNGAETAAESLASELKSQVSQASSKASEAVAPAESSASSDASEVLDGADTATESLASELKSQVSRASSKASQAALQAESSASSDIESVKESTESAKESTEQAASAASSAPKKVMGGVNAQVFVEAKQIIFDDVIDDDDEDTYSQKAQSLFAGAGDRATDLTKAVNEALGQKKTQGSMESFTSLASAQYLKALAAASSVLYGPEQKSVESATSVASERFAEAVTAASHAVYGTPTPTAVFKTAQAQASSRYNDAVSVANEQYSNAKSQFSALVSGTPKPPHETMLSMIDKAYSDSLAVASERLQVALQYTDSVKSYATGSTQGYFESVSSIASSRLSEGLSAASAQFTAEPTPALDGARRQYYEAVGLAHARYSDFVGAASGALYGPEQGTVASLASAASAASKTAQSVASDASASAKSAASKAGGAADSVASQVSSSVIGSETPWAESVASQASQNWEALIADASNQVYGAPTPWPTSVYSNAGAYAAQATAQAAAQYSSVQALISELVVGKEPDFTESVMQRFASAYYTGIPAAVSSVNSYASENYDAASSYADEGYEAASEYAADAYASASSVVSSIFTPPAAIETILSQANEQLNAAVESASVAVYGTQKGNVEQASESVASAYSSVQSKASEAIYGTQQAQDNFRLVASSAQAAISEAIYGTPTASGYAASATSGASSAHSSISSVASEKAESAASAVSSAVSSALYGPEQGAVESASIKLASAVEAANSRIADIYSAASKNAEGAADKAGSAASAATQRVKDEL
ncbi:hypothetical protein P280DRAFT_512348 [Massarina eburnea CBS 473.64]|uniref:Transcription factor hoxa13 n=1 Tax=Massarina eburnea CBS 473.64 TaxID=1395130 RepID=A0A6A6SEE6_9PLEO|nr:hypothetical protein P280DRAFT_512348 [Massarina eburnea CBS 473.64]